MPAFCEPKDVKDITGSTDPDNNAQIASWIAAASEWVRNFTGLSFFDSTSPVTETFYNMRDDAVIELHERISGVNSVTVFITAESAGIELVENLGYQVIDPLRFQLLSRHALPVPPGGVAPVGSIPRGRGLPIQYERVEITYVPLGVVPEGVRKATALIAATWMTTAPLESSGLQSENIGDYSYSMKSNTTGSTGHKAAGPVPATAITMLKGLGRSGIFVV